MLSFTPDSRQLISYAGPPASLVKEVFTLDVATGKKVSSFPTINPSHPNEWNLIRQNLCLSPNGAKLALVSPTILGVELWDSKTGQLLYSLPEQNSAVSWLDWSPDSHRLAVSRSNGEIAIWNLPEI